jgi:hypothetical protein
MSLQGTIEHLNLSISYLKVVDFNELIYENMSEEIKFRVKNYFSEDSELSKEESITTFNQVRNFVN